MARGGGLVWTVVVVGVLGLAEYGQYAMAFSLASIIAALTDSPFYVRSARVNLHQLDRDRVVRARIGAVLVLSGVAMVGSGWYVVGYAALFAGGETSLGVFKARYRHRGRPVGEQALDAARQLVSILLGIGAIVFGVKAIDGVTAAYAAPYVVVGCVAIIMARDSQGHDVSVREFLTLAGSSAVGAAYAQVDVVLLGALASSEAAGAYAIASLVAWSLTLPSLHLSTALIPAARTRVIKAGGVYQRLFPMAEASAAVGAFMGVILVAFLVEYARVGSALLILAPFVLGRSLNWGAAMIATVEHSDVARLRAATVAVSLDIACLLILLPMVGEKSAPLAAVLAEGALLISYARIVRAKVRWFRRCAISCSLLAVPLAIGISTAIPVGVAHVAAAAAGLVAIALSGSMLRAARRMAQAA